MGSGGGSVGKAVASDSRVCGSSPFNYYENFSTDCNLEKDKKNQKEPGIGINFYPFPHYNKETDAVCTA